MFERKFPHADGLLDISASFEILVHQMDRPECHRVLEMHLEWLDTKMVEHTTGHMIETIMLWEKWQVTHCWMYHVSKDGKLPGIHLAFLLDCPPNVAHGIAFRVDFYEFGAWLQIDASQPNTKKYDIRRWLRENDMLDRYADDDDRAYWEIPADYQAPRLDPSL